MIETLVVAIQPPATALVKMKSGTGIMPGVRFTLAGLPWLWGGCAALAALLLAGAPAHALSNKVRITKLTDVAFGTIPNLSVDAVRSQSVCLYSDTATAGYNVTATGSGTGGAFQLSGPGSLAFVVQWSSSAGQSSGVQLAPNVPLTGQVSSATQQACANGPATSASLIVILRSSALSSAGAGTYNGTLTLLIGPE